MKHAHRQAVTDQQNQFIDDIFSEYPHADERIEKGLAIYRNNLKATALQSLSMTFPTVYKQIGDELMTYVAHLLLKNTPPYRGDWAEWGLGLPNLLKTIPALEEYPFVVDSAQLDLAIHQSERAKNISFDKQSTYLLASHDLDNIYIKLNDSVHFFASQFPIIELREYEIQESECIKSKLQKQLQQEQFKQNILVYRPQLKVMAKEITQVELDWLILMAKEVSIGVALEQLGKHDFDFSHWLPSAIEQNLITKLFSY